MLGCLHPNKRADSFRQLIAGAPAFNSVSRSSLLLAEHPEDEKLRVLCRGKGNLSEKPPAVQFRMGSHHFEANGHDFSVPLAQDFRTSDFTVEDLIERSGTTEHSKVSEACEIITALLPRDGGWHPAKEIKDACAENGIDDRMAKRAKEPPEDRAPTRRDVPSSHRMALAAQSGHRRDTRFRCPECPECPEWKWPNSLT